MSVNKIIVKNTTNSLFMGHCGLIAKYVPGVLKESSFPIPVILVDDATKKEYEADLISVIGFQNVIPDIFCRFFEGESSEKATEKLLKRYNVSNINQLGFYTYEFRSRNSN